MPAPYWPCSPRAARTPTGPPPTLAMMLATTAAARPPAARRPRSTRCASGSPHRSRTCIPARRPASSTTTWRHWWPRVWWPPTARARSCRRWPRSSSRPHRPPTCTRCVRTPSSTTVWPSRPMTSCIRSALPRTRRSRPTSPTTGPTPSRWRRPATARSRSPSLRPTSRSSGVRAQPMPCGSCRRSGSTTTVATSAHRPRSCTGPAPTR